MPDHASLLIDIAPCLERQFVRP